MENTIKTSAPSITSSAMLVEYNASVWTGRKQDKNASTELELVKRPTPTWRTFTRSYWATAQNSEPFNSSLATHVTNTMP